MRLIFFARLGNEPAGKSVQVRELQADGCSRDFLNKGDEIQIIRFHFLKIIWSASLGGLTDVRLIWQRLILNGVGYR